jgi:hypothetical protein
MSSYNLSPCSARAAAKLKQNVWKDALVAVDGGQRGKYVVLGPVLRAQTHVFCVAFKVMGLGYALLRGEQGHL